MACQVLGGILAISALVACTPSATESLEYEDIDAAFLSEQLIAVATSRSSTSPISRGTTVFYGREHGVTRIDNAGLDSADIVYKDGVLGFSDLERDYELGARRQISDHSPKMQTHYAAYLTQSGLVSLFNGGFSDTGYDLPVVETYDGGSKTTIDNGYVFASAQCDDSIYALVNEDVESSGSTDQTVLKKIAPRGVSTARWEVTAGGRELGATGVGACNEGIMVAVASVTEGDELLGWVALAMNVETGESKAIDLTGLSREYWYLEAVAFDGQRLKVVATLDRPDQLDKEVLLDVDLDTGATSTLAELTGPAGRTEVAFKVLFETDGRYLYRLQPTRDDPTNLRAYDLGTGKLLAERDLDPLDKQVNGRFTSFDDGQVAWNFAVIASIDQW